MGGRAIVAQRLHVVLPLLRKIMPGNIEPQRAAEGDVKQLHAFTNSEDRQAALERDFHCRKFPFVAPQVWLLQDGWVRHRLMKIPMADISAACEKDRVHSGRIYLATGCVLHFERWIVPKKRAKPWLVAAANPGD